MRQPRGHDGPILVIGAGLAGSEAALQLSRREIPVELFEMRPTRMTEAHTTSQCAELVCSNSFGSLTPNGASAMLKEELLRLDAEVLACARANAVPAGASLAVDRDKFAAEVSSRIESSKYISVRREELTAIPEDRIVIIATGPLTTPALCESLCRLVGQESLYFYDAISPIVSADSLDYDKMFFANRYGKGDSADFLNIPLTREQYETFVADLLAGDMVLPHDFEEEKYFEACMPIEALAARGPRTLAFGPMKPVGLEDPKTGRRAHAVIQLRTENRHKTAFNLVGFQTKLKYKEQERIFRKLPGLENAEFLRLGSLHRNTFVQSPRVLHPTLQLRENPNVFLAGQLTGTEGYLESSATGWLAGTNAGRLSLGEPLLQLPEATMLGALVGAITDPERDPFQPMNSNLGILPPLPERPRDKAARNALHADRARKALADWMGVTSSGSSRPPSLRPEPSSGPHVSL